MDERGKRVRVTRRVRGSKAEANRQLRALINEIESGTHIKPSRLTLADFLKDQWLPAHRLAVRPTTYHSAVDYINRYITPRIGGVILSNVSREQIQGLYSTLLASGGRGGASPSPGDGTEGRSDPSTGARRRGALGTRFEECRRTCGPTGARTQDRVGPSAGRDRCPALPA
ncbi:MAG: hypothetical protein IIC92_03240 [Chloroflexi bacterium]|nr:hypothetical protein [Chloroflexota bacterium]